MGSETNISLYAAIIPSELQMLDAVVGLIGKAEAFCAERGVAPAELIGARLADDMLPFGYQAKSATVHSIGAIEGVRRGAFSPDMAPWPDSFAGLTERVAAARAALAAVDPAELDGFVGRDMSFVFGEHRIDYRAEDFLLSFSQPNFYFHVAMAYAILRMQGVAIGKIDFLGRTRRKPR